MAQFTQHEITDWTAVDLAEKFGPIPLTRIRNSPTPGTATEEDLIAAHDRENRLCELIEGVLVEKTVGTYESWIAGVIFRVLSVYVAEHGLGIMLGADGMLRLAPGLVRIPDVSFISWDRIPDRRVPREAIAALVPDLAVEVISPRNTRQEMDRKLIEYFQAGVRLVWYVYPKTRQVHVYHRADNCLIVGDEEQLDGGDVLPGLRLTVREIFAE